MQIKWDIDRKRGNYRPTLKFVITLEEHERSIAMHAVSVQSMIPRIPNGGRAWCMPGCDERAPGWIPADYHQLHVPYFKTGIIKDFIRLPFQADDTFPEVENSFLLLRDTYEKVVASVYSIEPVNQQKELTTSQKTKEKIAAALTAQKMLAFSF